MEKKKEMRKAVLEMALWLRTQETSVLTHSSQPSVTPVPEDRIPLLAPLATVHMWCTNMQTKHPHEFIID